MSLLSNRHVLAVLLVAPFVWSDRPAAAYPETHDGFMLRLTLGLGYEGLAMSDGAGTQVDLSGFGVSSSISLGGVVAENLALHGDFFGLSAVGPNASVNGEEFGSLSDSSVSLIGLTVGVTHWIMPLNLYLSGAIGLAKANIDIGNTNFEADWGFAVRALIGKEWWVAADWGLGIKAELIWANVPTDEDQGSASFVGFNVGMSVTYN